MPAPLEPISRSATEDQSAWFPHVDKKARGPTLLRSRTRPRLRVAGLVVFALVWTTIVASFGFDVVTDWRTGELQNSTLFPLTVFVLVEFGIVFVAVHQTLQLWNPRTYVTLGSPAVALGESMKISWLIDGRVEKLRRLSIDLEGREEVRFTRPGKSRGRATWPFLAIPVVDQAAPVLARGDAEVIIPATAMHSFRAKDNEIVWVVRVHGELAKWPDTNEELPFIVAPRRR